MLPPDANLAGFPKLPIAGTLCLLHSGFHARPDTTSYKLKRENGASQKTRQMEKCVANKIRNPIVLVKNFPNLPIRDSGVALTNPGILAKQLDFVIDASDDTPCSGRRVFRDILANLFEAIGVLQRPYYLRYNSIFRLMSSSETVRSLAESSSPRWIVRA